MPVRFKQDSNYVPGVNRARFPITGTGAIRNVGRELPGAYPPVDANHVHVWYGNSTDGSSINSDKGGIALTGGSNLVAMTGYNYVYRESIVNTGGTVQSLTANIGVSTGLYTAIEMIVYLPSAGSTSIAQPQLGLFLGDYYFYWRYYANNIAGYWPFVFESTMNWGDGEGLFKLNSPHHVMISHGYGEGNRVALIVDGVRLAGFGSTFGSTGPSSLGLRIPPGCAVSDIRVSSGAVRGTAYSAAAYQAILTM